MLRHLLTLAILGLGIYWEFIFRFTHPELTETQLVMERWHILIPLMLMCLAWAHLFLKERG